MIRQLNASGLWPMTPGSGASAQLGAPRGERGGQAVLPRKAVPYRAGSPPGASSLLSAQPCLRLLGGSMRTS